MKLSSPWLNIWRASSGRVWVTGGGLWCPNIPAGFPGFCIGKLEEILGGGGGGLFTGPSNPNSRGKLCRLGRKLKNFGEISWEAGALSFRTFPLTASRWLNLCFSGMTRIERWYIKVSTILKTYTVGTLVYCWHGREAWRTGGLHWSDLCRTLGVLQIGRTWILGDLDKRVYTYKVNISFFVHTFIFCFGEPLLVRRQTFGGSVKS